MQKIEIESFGWFAEQLDGDPAASVLAKEALGAAKGYLESLTELTSKAIPRS
jgi:hypothetical protein